MITTTTPHHRGTGRTSRHETRPHRCISRFGLSLLACSVFLPFLAGCGIFHHSPKSPDAPAEHPFSLTLTGKELLNSCGQSGGNALVVRVYALAGKETIQGLSLAQLWDREHQELKDDLIGEPTEIVLDPGGSQVVHAPRPAGTKFLAVAGNFCKTKPGCWLWIHPTSQLSGSMELQFDESCIKEGH